MSASCVVVACLPDEGGRPPSTRVTSTALTIIALGDWPAARLHARLVASGLRLSPEQEAAIDREWAAALAQRGVHLFDGPLCRLEGLSSAADGLHLSLSPTTYRVFMGTNGRHPEWAEVHGTHVMANPVGTSVTLRSADGMLIFGRRSERVALYPGFAHPFGGTMEPPPPGHPIDLIGEIRRELQEEIGLAANDLADVRVIGLIEDRHLRQPELVYAAESTLAAATISMRLDQHEHTSCWMVADDQHEIDRVLRLDEPITPVLAGTLLAWGWRRFGEAWLSDHLAHCRAERQPVARWG